MQDRRYDIDWLRVIAIALLLIYHVAIVFQSWGIYIGFIQSPVSSEILWIPMAMLNLWRIPLLFFVSGMGVCFALRRRNWKELLFDRTKRILLPLIFGSLFIVPIHIIIFQKYYNQDISFSPSFGHLWFLSNIFLYVLMIIGVSFLDKNYDYKFFNFLRKLLKHPYLIYLFIIPFVIEAELTNPLYFSVYIGNAHGFILGMLAFFFGFLFVAVGDVFWISVTKMRFISFAAAFGLYLIRLVFFEFNPPHYLAAIESINWIFAAFGFAYKYLNKPSPILNYLSQAAYPVYIIHMIFLYLAAYLILPLKFNLNINIILITLFTFVSCMLAYEFIIRRLNLIRPLFGLKIIPNDDKFKKSLSIEKSLSD
ncbi:MAG: acyltransferase family protein [Ignavibacteriales bacterium]|nr:acyltransferase family protein [Ignavibacteriales bacterium]